MKVRGTLKYFVTDCSYKISALTDGFNFFDQIFLKKVFPEKNRRIGHHHGILIFSFN